MQTVETPPSVPTGMIKSFGPVGPVYEVGPVLHQREDGDWLIEVTIVETGEKVEYSLQNALDDPEAA